MFFMKKNTEEQINFQMENSTKFVLTNFELQDNFGLPDLLKSKYRHSSIYAVNMGTQKKTAEAIPPKSRLLSSTKGEENRIEL